jgi:hypothetical protein
MNENPDPATAAPPGWRGSQAERWWSLALRTAHLVAVVALGAALLGAPVSRAGCGVAVLASGLILLAQDRWAGRIALAERAGAVTIVKLLLAAGMAWTDSEWALVVFWGLLVLSSLASHAPKRWRHAPLPGWRGR